ncbi:MAG: nucleotidyltransferase family protein [Arhodomonas sp.]|nr:nucleotidyltransferase family protein [Arhodomonas sp.]
MRAMILAAGRGERMRPLTDNRPKPLLEVGGRPLIDYHLRALAAAGVSRVVVNVAWHGHLIRDYLGDGSDWGLEVVISDEEGTALETAGGIRRALPLLGNAPFWVVNGDVWIDLDPSVLPWEPEGEAHLVLVDNPRHNPEGDFGYRAGRVEPGAPRLTFAGVGVYRPALFAGLPDGVHRLAPLLHEAAARGAVTASHHKGTWWDVRHPAAAAGAGPLAA